MADVAVRELRNDTAGVLRRVGRGEDVMITVHGRRVARVVPIESAREWMGAGELARLLTTRQADSGLRDDLTELAGDLTDELDAGW